MTFLNHYFLYFLFSVLFCFTPARADAQVYFVVEKINSPKTLKFPIGTEIFLKTKKTGWMKVIIEDLDVENQYLSVENGIYSLDEILSIRTWDQEMWIRYPAMKLVGYGVPALTYTLIAGIVHGTFSSFGLISGGITIGAGILSYFILRVSLQYRRSKYNYRILDISFGP